jgi:hypothetical protein
MAQLKEPLGGGADAPTEMTEAKVLAEPATTASATSTTTAESEGPPANVVTKEKPKPKPRPKPLEALLRAWSRLPPRAQPAIAGGSLVILGVVLGLMTHGRASKGPDDAMSRFARRVKAPEAEAARRALADGDVVSALAFFRTPDAYDHLRADPMAETLRGRLALLAHDPADALDWLEQGLANAPELTNEEWAAEAVVQTFGAKRTARTVALLARLPKPAVTAALRAACSDWQHGVRHGAADLLRTQGDNCPDPTGLLILDAWQLDKCDTARPVLKALAAAGATDERVAPVIDAVARRPALQGCTSEFLPRPTK